ncbi:MAG TPA: methionyl-tRNA formyltransferase [Gammaproteobacteria bacterium]|jgi:methionyl-tRNA formyltransferase|nr:methionyl-tRNA formyltransferase [Xanthomonadales bacterium]HOP22057.1 methionyl-tRNA formyltransferase [Gammaproteobacteria bacterium]MCB1594704.1 methionyl-tRNA formyltransferase [Xanthomonadales bacterium]MCB1603503.1 methionyl-tRNA formyltransferase [Xanthomonadales bacterium]HPI95044.1 methionyl-tRNA formyltransferase [Gammaproteobacteria bacterium]
MRIVFCGTPDFAVEPLKQLIQNNYDVVAVYTQPDKGIGRGRKVQYTPVKQYALDNNIEVYQPISLRTDDAINELRDLQPDLMVVVAYGLILPQTVLDIPKIACWNIHASLLPRWRGAAPIHRALLAGDKTTGVGIMQMEAGLDTGPVYLQHECSISEIETASQLHDKLKIMGASALIECLKLLESDLLPEPMIQSEEGVTYAKKLEKSESQISWQESAKSIHQKIRAFNPWPGVVAEINGESFKLWAAESVNLTSSCNIGEIVLANKEQLVIQCGDGQLKVTEIQKPGKNKISIRQFMQSKTNWYNEKD